ncbi:MAG: flagellar basal body rod protein FlgC [Phycisphaerae bacterium]
MFEALDIGASGLAAQRVRMNTIAQNVLNQNTTRNEQGEAIPFRRRVVLFQAGREANSSLGEPAKPGVHVSGIELDQSPFKRKFDPGHPDADKDGYVNLPNIDLSTEFVNMLEASRAFEANVTMMETTKAMLNSSFRLLA